MLVRQYLADVLPGLADRSIQSLAELTPMAYAVKMTKAACLRTPRPRQPCCCSEAYDQFAENPERFSNKYTLANIV